MDKKAAKKLIQLGKKLNSYEHEVNIAEMELVESLVSDGLRPFCISHGYEILSFYADKEALKALQLEFGGEIVFDEAFDNLCTATLEIDGAVFRSAIDVNEDGSLDF